MNVVIVPIQLLAVIEVAKTVRMETAKIVTFAIICMCIKL